MDKGNEFFKEKVRKYWNNQPCGTEGTHFPEGSLDFFEEVENYRHTMESVIHSFVQFTRWHGKKVLEVGCGLGTDLLQFARAGAKVYGIDLSSHSIELAKRRFHLYGFSGEIKVADAENLSFVSDQFDLVYSWGVLHHTPDVPKAIGEIYRVLKAGGSIKIMLYHRVSWYALKMYFEYGFFKEKPFTSVSKILSEHRESPGTKGYTVNETKEMFSRFSDLEVHPILTPYETRKKLWGIFPMYGLINLCGDRLGWFMLISGHKV
ncbi:MAG: class I SAM-dependent methyltransferase [bacterium]